MGGGQGYEGQGGRVHGAFAAEDDVVTVRVGSDGVAVVDAGGREILAVPGQTYVVAPGTSHRIVNHATAEAHLYSTLRPAMRSDELLETMWGLASDGRTNARGIPNLLQAAVSGVYFRGEPHLAGPPLWLQDLVFRLLAPLGRARGYQGAYIPRRPVHDQE